ncbi:hypothetical protein [Pseudactinotalea suaedae]|uniref:hypothetical protein n=1 Tax=Pseudactinotalea suaedae TaxID=1524924 RepID=UPI0012E13C1C|nr:hypothetical protein [Pseudactinotalea suaedae]
MGMALDELLAQRGLRASDRAVLRELIEGVWWSTRTAAEALSTSSEVVARAVERAAGSPAAVPLALYIRLVCEAAWDLTWDHFPLLSLLSTAERAWLLTPPSAGSEEHIALQTMLALRDELTLESAGSTGDLAAMVEAAADLSTSLAALASMAGVVPTSGVATHLATMLDDRLHYAEAVGLAARTASHALAGEGRDVGEAAAALAQLRAAEEFFAPTDAGEASDHASLSEIRAHRAAIESVLAAADRDWLRIDDGMVVCLFPFGLRHAEQTQIVEAVKRHAASWSLGGKHLGNRPTSLLLIDDCWRGDDPLQRRYDGTQLDLPDLQLPDLGQQPTTARVTVLISQLGNHCLRVEIPLESAMPHEVAARVWAAAPEYGHLGELGRPLRFAGGGGPAAAWPRLAAFAKDVLDDLTAALATTDLGPVALSWRPGMFHVVTTVRQASVLPGGRAEDASTLEDARAIAGLFGAQPLCHPLPSGWGSVAPWARYQVPHGTTLHCAGLTDDVVLVTENHTLLASFTSADYMVATVAQAVEFVVSLEGMFAAWQDELSDFYLGLRPHLHRLDAADDEDPDLDDLQRILSDLQRRQLRLRQFLTSARVNLLFIAAPALVTSPVMRRTVSDLLELSTVWRQRAEFTDNAGQALTDRVTDLIESWSRRKEEKLERRNRLLVNTLLAVLAGIGISGLLSMVQDGFAVTGWGSATLVALVLVVAALVGVISYRSEVGRRERQRAKVPGGRRGASE